MLVTHPFEKMYVGPVCRELAVMFPVTSCVFLKVCFAGFNNIRQKSTWKTQQLSDCRT